MAKGTDDDCSHCLVFHHNLSVMGAGMGAARDVNHNQQIIPTWEREIDMTIKPGQIYHWPDLMGYGPGTWGVVYSCDPNIAMFMRDGYLREFSPNWNPSADVNLPELLGELAPGQTWVDKGGKSHALTGIVIRDGRICGVKIEGAISRRLSVFINNFEPLNLYMPASTQATTVPATCKSRDRGSKCIYPLSHDGDHFNGFNSRW